MNVFGRSKNDGKFRVELKFKDGGEGWLVTDDYQQACAWYDVFKTPTGMMQSDIIEVIIYKENKPLARWCNSAALAC